MLTGVRGEGHVAREGRYMVKLSHGGVASNAVAALQSPLGGGVIRHVRDNGT